MSVKKFGTFAGVFTPSILTILGVIMYLRLGWVVGNAGLYGTIIIILVAHIISITTGLSISSIATDKKVGAGGVYYVLSRSLGLPIGGSIGVTLFIGTALSIALYLVGFAESLNAYFGLDTSINGLRISGSIALWALTLLAFISTSIALKAQFFIMAAIAASLVAIFFGHSDFKPTDILLFPNDTSVPIEMVFAVFFPAVTGFTAGIAMSGDLKDPKKSIPAGTIAAIAVGLVVYIGLAIFIAYNIDAETLRNDYNILMKIALFAPAVVAGIWGATLSSALGGILGAPRILQAMSTDRITPQFFAKGKGAANEPLNALILTVIIAQAGILIGELDIIARVVSMFYLAAYGFINLSFFLESWASTDFKPTFKVKRWIGALGFVATFAVMFKLDAPAMIASFIIMGVIYFYLARKELSLGTGDIWQSVWSNIIKRGLLKLEAKEEHIRNWKPNILLFSGGSSARPHLIEFAKDLVSNNGFVTNFDLIENPQSKKLFPTPKKVVQDELLQKYHLFGRKIEVKNIYDGIQTLATTFGFSGIEPNTILLGWARNTKNPKDFARLTQNLIEQDFNVLFLDYDARLGFGKYETIDIWWNQRNRNGVLMLNLARLLQNSDDWRNAKIRLIHVNNSDVPKKIIESKLKQIADEFRVQVDVKIINNAIEKIPVYDLILTHSGKTDLILAGIPELMNNEEKFVSETNKLLYNIGTTLLVKASSKFEELADTELVPKQIIKEKTTLHSTKVKQIAAISTNLPSNSDFAQLIAKLDDYFIKILNDYLSEYTKSLSATYTDSISEIENLVCNTNDLVTALEQIRAKSQNFKSEQLPLLKNILDEGIAKFISEWTYFVKQQPKKIKCQLSENDLKFITGESHYSKTIKRAKRLQLKLFGKASITIKWRKIAGFYVNTHLLKTLKEYEHEIGVESAAVLIMIQKNIHQLIENFDKQAAKQQFAETRRYISATQEKIQTDFINKNRLFFNQLAQQLSYLDINDIYEEKIDDLSKKELLQLKKHCLLFPQNWLNNQRIFHNQFEEDLQLNELNTTVFNESKNIEKTVLNDWILPLKSMASGITENTDFQPLDYYNIQTIAEELHQVFHQQLLQLQDTVTVIHPDDFNNFKENQEHLNLITLDIYQIVDFLLENRFISPTINLLKQTADKLYDIRNRLNNLTQLQTYGNNDVSEIEKTEITKKLQTDLSELLNDIEYLKSNFTHQFDDIKSTIVHELDIRFIIEQSGQLSQYIKSEQRKKGWKKYKALSLNLIKKLYKKIEAFYLKLSDKWLQSEYIQQLEAYTNDTSRLQIFVNNLSISAKVTEHLPQYYQQLFGKKHLFNNYFAVSRKIELQHFEQLLTNNLQGAILITGNPKSGKTYFVEAAIKKLNPHNHIIISPVQEEKSLQTLNKSIAYVSRKKGETQEILEHLPNNTLLIFENIETWNNPFIENNPLAHILQLAEQNKHRLQFIFTTNKHNISVLNNKFNFSKYISGTVLLRDLSLKHIETILLERHRTGGIDLFYGDTNINKLKRSEKRKLFSVIYLLSKGNIGIAMQLWLAFITLEYDKILTLKPHYVYPFPTITDNYLISLIYLFYLNKNLTQKELNHYFGNNQWQENIATLINTHLVTKSNQKVYEIHPDFLPWIETFLQSKNIIL